MTLNPWAMLGAGWAFGIALERATPGGPTPWWAFALLGLVNLIFAFA
jgi:hypothetical protein